MKTYLPIAGLLAWALGVCPAGAEPSRSAHGTHVVDAVLEVPVDGLWAFDGDRGVFADEEATVIIHAKKGNADKDCFLRPCAMTQVADLLVSYQGRLCSIGPNDLLPSEIAQFKPLVYGDDEPIRALAFLLRDLEFQFSVDRFDRDTSISLRCGGDPDCRRFVRARVEQRNLSPQKGDGAYYKTNLEVKILRRLCAAAGRASEAPPSLPRAGSLSKNSLPADQAEKLRQDAEAVGRALAGD